MSTEVDRPLPFVNPRPGVVTALGVLNVLFSVILLIALMTEFFWLYAVFKSAPGLSEPGAAPSANSSGIAIFGMNDPRFIRFTLVDAITGLVLNLIMSTLR